jgi:hypothetical protein
VRSLPEFNHQQGGKMAIPKLREGVLYRLIYKQQAGNYQWYKKEVWAKYLGDDSNSPMGHHLFSLRPLAGTQRMPSKPKLPVSLGRLETA